MVDCELFTNLRENMLTTEQLASVEGLSARRAAQQLGVGKSTIARARSNKAGQPNGSGITPHNPPSGGSGGSDAVQATGYSFEQCADGTVVASTRPSEAPQSLEDALQVLRDKELDLDAYNVTYSYSEWETGNRVLHSYRMRATPKPVPTVPQLDADELLRVINDQDFSYELKDPDTAPPRTLVVTPSDLQIGKVDYNGGTKETLERVAQSFTNIKLIAARGAYDEIVVAELGDVIENFYNTSSQRETNDLDLTNQIRVARRLLLDLIVQLAPLTKKLYYVSVPSNHGTVRVGFKQPAAGSNNDWGIEISHQLEDAVRQNPTLNHVQFIRPDGLHESVALKTVDGTTLGFVHGHQARSADKLGEWWKGQSHGGMPVATADILLCGHWHSFRVQQSGNARWVMVSPTSDSGSAWFTEQTGERSRTGMLSFVTDRGGWQQLEIV
jgi:hypothetical protein